MTLAEVSEMSSANACIRSTTRAFAWSHVRVTACMSAVVALDARKFVCRRCDSDVTSDCFER